MHLLLIGGAGHLGSIVRPALERRYTCRYLDVKPVPDAADRTIVADVNDDDAVRRALEGIDVALYMALGAGEPFAPLARPRHPRERATTGDAQPPRRGGENRASPHHNLEAAMSVNVLGLYRALMYGLEMGVRRFVHASSLSVYDGAGRPYPVDETRPPDAWAPYGLTKRLSEDVCQAATMRYPQASILALRLVRPVSPVEWPQWQHRRASGRRSYALGPRDTQRLYEAAVRFDRPGFHPVQAAGDVDGQDIPYRRALELLDWQPRGE